MFRWAREPAQVTVRIDDDDGLTISVADSGPGVPEHLREAIFARGVTSKPEVPGGRASAWRWCGWSPRSTAGQWR